jgi:predicted RNA-binding Zn-ribbon protein involved in translation (DUF1610 family)
MKPLKPLKCGNCGGSPPLVAATSTPCPFCSVTVAIPDEYARAAQARASSDEARMKAEPIWRLLSGGIPKVFIYVGAILMVILPPVATGLGHLLPETPLASAQILAIFALPAILPGGLVFTLAGALRTIGRPYKIALGARPPEKEGFPPGCRTCGAGLKVTSHALSASCAYCGTDSIVEGISAKRERAALSGSLRSLGDAVRALRRRWAWTVLGILGAFALIGGLSALVAMAFFMTV